MKKGRAFQLVSQMGEYLVAVELGRRGYISTTFTQNIPDFDIIAIDESLKRTIPIQVKTIRGSAGIFWPFAATTFMNIELDHDREIQIVKRKVRMKNPDLVYVFVRLGEKYGEDEFYLLRKKEVQNLICDGYKKWLRKHNGHRPKKWDSFRTGIETTQIEKLRDNWKILKETKRHENLSKNLPKIPQK